MHWAQTDVRQDKKHDLGFGSTYNRCLTVFSVNEMEDRQNWFTKQWYITAYHYQLWWPLHGNLTFFLKRDDIHQTSKEDMKSYTWALIKTNQVCLKSNNEIFWLNYYKTLKQFVKKDFLKCLKIWGSKSSTKFRETYVNDWKPHLS